MAPLPYRERRWRNNGGKFVDETFFHSSFVGIRVVVLVFAYSIDRRDLTKVREISLFLSVSYFFLYRASRNMWHAFRGLNLRPKTMKRPSKILKHHIIE